jgi:hypothetical protein
MADIKFSCPHCSQNITCDELWGGHQLQCPSCGNNLIVPGQPAPASAPANSLVPKPPASVSPRLSIGQAHAPSAAAGTPGAAPQKTIPIRNLAPPPKAKKSPLVKYLSIAAVLVVLGVGGYFGYFWLSDFQAKANAKREAAERNSGGGEVGHIANLNKVLDATEPGRPLDGGRSGSPRKLPSGAGQEIALAAGGASNGPAASADSQALIPPAWSLEIAGVKISETKVNGMISGTNFVLETARVDPVGPAQVLRLIQGQMLSPDRELLVYLHLKPGEKLGGQTVSVSQDMVGSAVPQVAKRWKTNPKFAPQIKSFYNGYAMKLELGQMAENAITGKIFVSLPDAEHSVIAGVFKANLPVIDPNAQPQAAPVMATPTAQDPARAAAQEAYDRRYGIKR